MPGGLGRNDGDAVVTKDRLTTLEFEPVTQYLLSRPVWYLHRKAHEIGRADKEGRRRGVNTRLEPSVNAWRLVNTRDQPGLFNTAAFTSRVVPLSDLNVAGSVQAFNAFRRPDDLNGVSTDGSVVGGVPLYRRTIPNNQWDADGQVMAPSPPSSADEPNYTSLLRLFNGKVTYPANACFTFGLGVGLGIGYPFNRSGFDETPGDHVRFYFGGPTDRVPATAFSGQFCLAVRAEKYMLWERTGEAAWALRLEVANKQPGVAYGTWLSSLWTVQPLGRNNLIIGHVNSSDGLFGPQKLKNYSRGELNSGTCYRNNPGLTGFNTARFITGAGQTALDVRRDFRGTVLFAHNGHRVTGTVTDLPFIIPWPKIPAATILTLKLNAELLPGTEITVQLYDATDDTELTPTTDPISATQPQAEYELAANQGKLYVKFTLTGDGNQTPLLNGFEVEVAGLRQTRVPTPVTGGVLRQVSITGPDYDPSHATASAQVSDLTAQLNALLPVRNAIHARIKTEYDSDGNTTVLHEGLLIDARAVKRGRSFRDGLGADVTRPRAYPSANWRDYSLSFASMWARVQRQINLSVETFFEDPDADPNPDTNQRPPWKITAIIRYLLYSKLGVPDTQLDIPDIDLRLWPTEGTTEDLILQPGVSLAEFLIKLARDYLGMVLLWDPNAGTANGMWRLIANPQSPFTALATFVAEPTGSGKIVTHPNSYGATETFIIEGSYESWVVPPEANFIVVTSTGALLPSDGGTNLTLARIYNKLSFDWDPASPTSDSTHPDYLGECVPLIVYNQELTTGAALAFYARRLYDRVAHAEKWFSFQAPALYIPDATDDDLAGRKRPLRINDVVTVLGSTALVRSATYHWTSDVSQKMTIEGRYLT